MPRVASLFLPQLPIERLRRLERPRTLPEPAARAELPVDDDPGPARFRAVAAGGRARAGRGTRRKPVRRSPPGSTPCPPTGARRCASWDAGRKPRIIPFRAMRPDEGGRSDLAPGARIAPPRVAPMILAAIGRPARGHNRRLPGGARFGPRARHGGDACPRTRAGPRRAAGGPRRRQHAARTVRAPCRAPLDPDRRGRTATDCGWT